MSKKNRTRGPKTAAPTANGAAPPRLLRLENGTKGPTLPNPVPAAPLNAPDPVAAAAETALKLLADEVFAAVIHATPNRENVWWKVSPFKTNMGALIVTVQTPEHLTADEFHAARVLAHQAAHRAAIHQGYSVGELQVEVRCGGFADAPVAEAAPPPAPGTPPPVVMQ